MTVSAVIERIGTSVARHPHMDSFGTRAGAMPCRLDVGDILEKRKRMLDERYSTAAVECMTTVNLVLLVVFWVLRVVVDILPPFKTP